jgi:hypothetical protein
MSIAYNKSKAVLKGHVTVEDAEPLAQWVREHPRGALEMSECDSLHAAVVQVLLALRPPLKSPPRNPWLAAAMSRTSP